MIAPRVVPPLPILMILGDQLKKARRAQEPVGAPTSEMTEADGDREPVPAREGVPAAA